MREWLEQELGVAPWVFEGVFLPLLAFVGVLLARELLLLSLRRKLEDPERRKIWRRRSFWAALPLAILSAVGASWHEETSAHGWFASPDNCAIDAEGRLWVATATRCTRPPLRPRSSMSAPAISLLAFIKFWSVRVWIESPEPEWCLQAALRSLRASKRSPRRSSVIVCVSVPLVDWPGLLNQCRVRSGLSPAG